MNHVCAACGGLTVIAVQGVKFECWPCKTIHDGNSRLLWERQDRTTVAVEDMDSTHILRCIGMIFRKNSGWRGKYMKPLIEELKRRNSAKSDTMDFGDRANFEICDF